jgi:hypothetical protein
MLKKLSKLYRITIDYLIKLRSSERPAPINYSQLPMNVLDRLLDSHNSLPLKKKNEEKQRSLSFIAPADL